MCGGGRAASHTPFWNGGVISGEIVAATRTDCHVGEAATGIGGSTRGTGELDEGTSGAKESTISRTHA